jgi:hypothetical protein
MSKRSQDKRRARAKEKKQNKRREQGISPLSRLAGVAEDVCECWSSYAEEDGGIRSVTVMRPIRGGGHVAAFFLIDYDCIGLKDAFVRLNVDALEVRENLRAKSISQGVRLVRITTQDARQMLASAIRWTLDHPFFRLPADAERCLKIVGGAGELENADVRDFGTEDGGLLYIFTSDASATSSGGWQASPWRSLLNATMWNTNSPMHSMMNSIVKRASMWRNGKKMKRTARCCRKCSRK